MRTELYSGRTDKPVTLMDMAVIGAKYLKKHGKLEDIELSEEINACSIYIDVHTEDSSTGAKAVEKWLLMFKNETHNHPTEIEPFEVLQLGRQSEILSGSHGCIRHCV